MSQPSVVSYFNTRKRPATEDIRLKNKVLVLDGESDGDKNSEITDSSAKIITPSYKNLRDEIVSSQLKSDKLSFRNKVVTQLNFDTGRTSPKPIMTVKKSNKSTKNSKKVNLRNQPDIQKVFLNMGAVVTSKKQPESTDIGQASKEKKEQKPEENSALVERYPVTPTKKMSTMEKIHTGQTSELSLAEIKNKLSRSNRLAELKASLSRSNKLATKLEEAEKKAETKSCTTPTSLKTFTSIDLEVPVSPQKTPTKSYLSPVKSDIASPRKNLFGSSSPTKSASSCSPTKLPAYQRFEHLTVPSLPLPYRYRCLLETFRSVDEICAMLYNRKELITFTKVKRAVLKSLRRNLTEDHLGQIKQVYPDAYAFKQEKVRNYGSPTKRDNYELIISPVLANGEKCATEKNALSCSVRLQRRRKLQSVLLNKVKDYHAEFLATLDPPMTIAHDRIRRWHDEFNLEHVPDIEVAELPQPPNVEKYTTAQDVLSKAQNLFTCNSKMEETLKKLSESDENKKDDASKETESSSESILALKGIPKSLLERVRARQAAKALEVITRTPAKDKEAAQWARLPELAKMTRNVFITEKKGVLPIEIVQNKLNNSFRERLTEKEFEEHLRMLSRLLPTWLAFIDTKDKRLFLKLSKEMDINKVIDKLEKFKNDKLKHKL